MPLLLLYLPVLVVIVAIFGVATLFYRMVIVPLGVMGLRRRMRSAGRAATWADVENQRADRPSSLIVEYPTPGWSDVNIWLADTSVTALATEAGVTARPLRLSGQFEPEDMEARLLNPAYERWCVARLFDRSSGIARLVHSTHSGRGHRQAIERVERLRSNHPMVEFLEAETWMAHMAEHAARKEAGKRPRSADDY